MNREAGRVTIQQPNAPLFRDPIYDGAADPTLIWNREEQSWWMIYTNRRATVEVTGYTWIHGTDLGVASSTDGGRSWLYRGTLNGLEFEKGRNTYWAPEIIYHDGIYHMYCSYVRGIPEHWNYPRHIVHYTSSNLWDWEFQSVIPLSSDRVIDACLYRMPNGKWRMWYKDEANQSHTYAADSEDLYHWESVGQVITDRSHEGPNVFHWQNSYWMITDPWCGQGVYRSEDLEEWTFQGFILDTPGSRPHDQTIGQHADVVVQGENAYIFYFTHPVKGRPPTSVQVAKFGYEDGKLVCDRDLAFVIDLQPEL
jgi:hypothetical protein